MFTNIIDYIENLLVRLLFKNKKEKENTLNTDCWTVQISFLGVYRFVFFFIHLFSAMCGRCLLTMNFANPIPLLFIHITNSGWKHTAAFLIFNTTCVNAKMLDINNMSLKARQIAHDVHFHGQKRSNKIFHFRWSRKFHVLLL